MRRSTAFTLVELLVALAIVGVLIGLTLSAVQMARAAASRAACGNNLRQLALGLHNGHEAHGRFPPGVRVSADLPFASWVTRILPQLENAPAWAEALEDYARQPTFSRPVPHRNLARTLAVALCPAGSKSVGTTDEHVTAAFTYYLGVSGSQAGARNGVLFVDSQVRVADIKDGASQTLLLGERPPSPDNHFGWWYAGVGQRFDASADFLLPVREVNQSFRTPTCPTGPYAFRAGSASDECDIFHYWSLHAGGAHFAFADGSVRFLRYEADAVLPALATRAGGESVNVPE